MVFFNYATMQMAAKIVYYGPGLCGKTTNLHWIYSKTAPQSRGEMVSLETETDRTLFFDLLPLDVGVIGGFKTRLQLYTVPGQVFYNTTRKLVLKGVDGVVFVADSQRAMFEANVESFKNLRENLAEIGLELEDLPIVIQLNKKDLPNIIEREVILKTLDPDSKCTAIEAAAIVGEGVFETLKEISKLTLRNLRRRMMGDEGSRAPIPPLVRQPALSRQPAKPRETHVGFNPQPAFLKTTPMISPLSAPTGPMIASSTSAQANVQQLSKVGQTDFVTENLARAEENPFPDEGPVGTTFIEQERDAPNVRGPLDDETEMSVSADPPTSPQLASEPEVTFTQTPTDSTEAPPKVKHVRVRSTADIMAELDSLRKKATESSGRSRLAGGRAITQKLVQMAVTREEIAQTSSLRVIVAFEDENGNVVQQREQVVPVEITDVQSLLLKVKIETNG